MRVRPRPGTATWRSAPVGAHGAPPVPRGVGWWSRRRRPTADAQEGLIIMDSKRLKADARAYMKQHPGTSYQEALRAVTSVAGQDRAQPSGSGRTIDLVTALGIDDIRAHDFEAVWARNERAESLRIPYATYRFTDGTHTGLQLRYVELAGRNFEDAGAHVAIIGKSGFGKSHLLRTLVVSLAATYPPSAVGFVLADGKGGGVFQGFDRLPHTVASVSPLETSERSAERLSEWINDEVRRREELIFADPDCTNIGQFNRRTVTARSEQSPIPRIVVVLDELGPVERGSAELMQSLIRLGRFGRVLGMHLVVSDQVDHRGSQHWELFSMLDLRIDLSVDDRRRFFAPLPTNDAPRGELLQPIIARLCELETAPGLAQVALSGPHTD